MTEAGSLSGGLFARGGRLSRSDRSEAPSCCRGGTVDRAPE